jgi:hypothetical protein
MKLPVIDTDLVSHPTPPIVAAYVVTTNGGYGLAPVIGDEAQAYMVEAMSTVEQISERSITAALPIDWDATRQGRSTGARSGRRLRPVA